MRKSTIWGLALASVIGSGAVAATSLAPVFTQVARDAEADPADYELLPASGETVTNLQTIQLTFPNVKGVELMENMANPIILKNLTTGVEYYCAGAERQDRAVSGTSFLLYFIAEGEEEAAPITEAGSYELIVKEGAFFYAEEDEEGIKIGEPIKLPAISAVYAIGGVPFTTNPQPGSVVADLSLITLTFPSTPGVEHTEVIEGVVLENITTGQVYQLAGATLNPRATKGGSAYELRFKVDGEEDAAEINQPGEYELVVKTGAFAYNEYADKVKGFTLKYTIDGIAFAFTPQSQSVVTDLSQISLNFPTVDDVQFEGNFTNSIVLKNETTGVDYLLAGDPDRQYRSELPGTTYNLQFVQEGTDQVLPINQPGKYTLLVKEGAFYYGEDNTKVQELNATYSISGLEYNLTPASGEAVNDLSEITINFPTENGVEFEGNFAASVVLKNESTGVEYLLAGDPDRQIRSELPGTTYKFMFVQDGEEEVVPINQPGRYTLLVKEGAFYYGEGEETTKVQQINAVYTVNGIAYELTPASGETVTDLSLITISFPDVKGVEFEGNYANSIVLKNETTGVDYLLASDPNRDTYAAPSGTAYQLYFVKEGEEEVVPIQEPGQYTLLIKEGAFYTEENAKVQEINAVYSIAGISYSLTPASGETVEDLQMISINFPTIKGVEYVENVPNSIVLTNETTGADYVLAGADRAARAESGTSFNLYFASQMDGEVVAINEPGKYVLTIKEGAFAYGAEDEIVDGEVVENPSEDKEMFKIQAISAEYTIAGFAWSLDPAPGSVVEDLSKINISFPEYKGVNVINERDGAIVLVNHTTGNEYLLAVAQRNTYAEKGTEYTLYFNSEIGGDVVPITEPGKYELIIKDGTFGYGDDEENVEKIPAISAEYVIAGVSVVVTPASGSVVESIDKIELNFLTDEDVFYMAGAANDILLENTTTGEMYTLLGDPTQETRANNKGVTFVLVFAADGEDEPAVITAEGNYLLTVKEGAFVAGNEKIDAIEATYVIEGTSGVENIFGADETVFNVYTVNGVQVLKNAAADAVKALPNGLYIINGKKVIVK